MNKYNNNKQIIIDKNMNNIFQIKNKVKKNQKINLVIIIKYRKQLNHNIILQILMIKINKMKI